jgi:hypothetical protein
MARGRARYLATCSIKNMFFFEMLENFSFLTKKLPIRKRFLKRCQHYDPTTQLDTRKNLGFFHYPNPLCF